MTDNNKKFILMFPGQGSQYINMGSSFLEKNKKYLNYFEISSEIFGENILDIVQNKNEKGSLLENTRYSQIAIYTLSCALNDFLCNELGVYKKSVVSVLGHSLGDYSALYCCGAYDFAKGAEIVSFRGKIMARSPQRQDGNMLMAAVLGCDIESIAEVLASYRDRVFIANKNDAYQTVISGYTDDVIAASAQLKSCGAKRVIPLKVNIASHCPLMSQAASELDDYLKKHANFKDIETSFFSSTELKFIDKENIKEMLVRQLLNPVNWKGSIEIMADKFLKNCPEGCAEEVSFIEIGPGKVLSGLVKRILLQKNLGHVNIFNTDSMDEIERINI
ncbi:MAG: acyltransferase domain-containing protein [Actinobacteria bacterium]|nr:acyltransferase domain-containing protein [Actinomycetota bacterium]